MIFDKYSIKAILLTVVAILNLISYFLFYLDKRKAKKKQPRISEKTLITLSFLVGGLGAWFGMKQFHHKTKHFKFRMLIPIAALLTIGMIYFIFKLA